MSRWPRKRCHSTSVPHPSGFDLEFEISLELALSNDAPPETVLRSPTPLPSVRQAVVHNSSRFPRYAWLRRLPARVAFVDVETTGLHSGDRVVSLAAISLETQPLADGEFRLQFLHLIFD